MSRERRGESGRERLLHNIDCCRERGNGDSPGAVSGCCSGWRTRTPPSWVCPAAMGYSTPKDPACDHNNYKNNMKSKPNQLLQMTHIALVPF